MEVFGGGAEVAELGVRVTSSGTDRVKSDFAEMATAGEASAERMGRAGSAGASRFSQAFVAESGKAALAAQAYATKFEAEFVADMARVSEGRARGIITAEQARRAGQEAAQTYNQGLLSQLDKLGGAGLNVSNSKAYADLAGSLKVVDAAAGGAHGNLGRLGQELTTLARRSLETAPIVGQLGYVLGQTALGSVATIGILGGIAAIGLAYRALTEDSRKAKEEQEKLTKALGDWYDQQLRGGSGQFEAQIAAETKALREMRKALDDTTKGKTFSDIPEFLKDATKAFLVDNTFNPLAASREFEKLWNQYVQGQKAAIVKGGAEVKAAASAAYEGLVKSSQEFFGQQASNLGSLITAGVASPRQVDQAGDLLGKYRGILSDLQKRYDGIADAKNKAFNLSQQADAISHITALEGALTNKVSESIRERDAQTAKLRAVNDVYGQSAESIALLTLRLDTEIERTKAHVAAKGAQREAIDRSIDAQLREKETALLNAQVAADQAHEIEKITASLKTLQPQWAVNEKALKDVADAQKYLNDQMAKVAEIGARNAKTTKEQTDATADAIKKQQKYAEDLRAIWRDGFSKIITDGLKSFNDFAEDVLRTFSRLMQRMEQEGKASGFGYKLLGLGSSALTGGLVGYQVGQRTNTAFDAAGAGAVSGAIAGGQIAGPWGAVIGGLTGAVGGLLGAADAHRRAAKAIEDASKSLATNIASYTTGSPVAGQLLQNATQHDALILQAQQLAGQRLGQAAKDHSSSEADAAFAALKRDTDAINKAQAENAAKIARDFWAGITADLNALNGPAGVYANALAAIQKQYDENVASAKALEGENASLIGIERLRAAQEAALKAAEEERLKQLQLSLDAREAYAKGLTAEGDAIRRRAEEDAQLFQAQRDGYTDAQLAQLKYIQGLEDEAAARDKAVQNQQAGEDYKVRLLQAQGHTEEAEALRAQFDAQREYEKAVKDGLDESTLAALKLVQAAEAAAAAAAKAVAANRALEDLQVRALAAQGNQTAADQRRFELQQQREVEDAIKAGQSQEYIDKLREVLKLEADQRAREAAGANLTATATRGPQLSAEAEAVKYTAKGLTEVTGNRLADYLASITSYVRELRDIARARSGLAPTGLSAANLTATAIPIAPPVFAPQPLLPPTDASALTVPRAAAPSATSAPPTIILNITLNVNAPSGTKSVQDFSDELLRDIAPKLQDIIADDLVNAQRLSGSTLIGENA